MRDSGDPLYLSEHFPEYYAVELGDHQMRESRSEYLAPINTKSIVENVVSRLTSAIMSGELKPGDKIPTETDLVRSFGVGRNTVREAVRILVAYGILEVRRADGTYVCDGFSPKILDPMLYGIILQKESAHHDLIGFRKLLDGGILREVFCAGITDETWERLNDIQDDLEQYLSTGENDVAVIAEKDIAFHHELAVATKNIAVITTYSSIVQITEDFLYKTIQTILQQDAVSYFSESHRGIMEKLRGQSLEELFERVDWSYRYWYKTFEQEAAIRTKESS